MPCMILGISDIYYFGGYCPTRAAKPHQIGVVDSTRCYFPCVSKTTGFVPRLSEPCRLLVDTINGLVVFAGILLIAQLLIHIGIPIGPIGSTVSVVVILFVIAKYV